MPVVQDLLTPSVVRGIISRIRTPGGQLSRLLGTHLNGPATDTVTGRTYTYDIYDNVRRVSRARFPGVPNGTVAANPVGNVTVTLARFGEKLILNYDKLIQIRTLGQNAGMQDKKGVKYVEEQAKTLRQSADNVREFVTAGALLRGGVYSFYQSGDDLLPSFDASGGYITVDHQIPSSNKLTGSGAFAAGLQMGTGSNIITADWATAATDIPLAIQKVSAAFQAQVGQPLKYIFVDSTMMLNILQNDKVRQLAGTSHQPFAALENTGNKNPDGTDGGLYWFELRGLPYFRFYVYDGGLDVSTSGAAPAFTKLLPTGYVTFMIEPDSQWFKCIEGSEFVKDNDIAPAVERTGFYSHILEKADPARFELHTIQNVGMEVNIPKGIAYARVTAT